MDKKNKSLRNICLSVQGSETDLTFSCIYDNSKPLLFRMFYIFQFLAKRFFQSAKFGINYLCYDVQGRKILWSKKFFSRSLPPEFFQEQNSLYYILEYINGVEMSEYLLLSEQSKPITYEFIIVHSIDKPKTRLKSTLMGLMNGGVKWAFPAALTVAAIILVLAAKFIGAPKIVSGKQFSFKSPEGQAVKCSYYGEWDDNAPNGQGELVVLKGAACWKEGDRLVGEFDNGFIKAGGNYIFMDGSKYIGGFENNMLSGVGTITFPNNEKLVAEFENNAADGQGVYTYLNGDIFDGIYESGLPNGFGVYKFADGGKYEGIFKNGKEDVFGKYIFPNGNYYEGEYKDGAWNGRGVLKKADGSVIEQGEWKNNKILKSDIQRG